MKVFEFLRPEWGRAFGRISEALHRYAPSWVEWTDLSSSDLALIHVIGGGDTPIIFECLNAGKKFVIVQHTYFTSAYEGWEELWKQALLTVSFHDLPSYTDTKFNFFRTPWGVDGSLFKLSNFGNRTIKVFTTGHVAATECIDTVHDACVKTGNILVHTGEDFKWSTGYSFKKYMENPALIALLNNTQYVTGLRNTEGFEMMALEGFFCGAVPIVPDLPTYDWYKDFGVLIDMDKSVEDQLVTIFNSYPSPVSKELYDYVTHKFEWKNIVPDIFSAIGQH